jgi:flagellar biosynthesis/type III secretory pathway protein FliH
MPDVDDEISEFEKEGYLYQYGRDAGLEQGLEQGLALAREALIDLLEALGHTLDERARTKVAACREPEQLRAWLRGAREARSVDDLLA